MKASRWMSGLRQMRRSVVVLVLVALMPLVFGGCYGRFPLTKKIYDWNGQVSDSKWVKTLVMWAFSIIPVYQVGMLVDVAVLNLVEFWGGGQLMAMDTVDDQGNTLALAPSPDGSEAVLTVSRDGKVLAQERFVKVSDATMEVRSADGELRGMMLRLADGSIQLTDAHGQVMSELPAVAMVQ